LKLQLQKDQKVFTLGNIFTFSRGIFHNMFIKEKIREEEKRLLAESLEIIFW